VIKRNKDKKQVRELIELFPATAILGARQCGKTTLAKEFAVDHYFDLENPRDLAKLDHPQLTLENLSGLIVIDEVQRKPDLFTLLRYLIDNNTDQKYLLLGSASRILLKQSSETLAGRIGYFNLNGFQLWDINKDEINSLWLRGGFPLSFLAESDFNSNLWRENYINTFLERDIPQLGISIPATTLRRFWMMLSHYHGQVLNYSEIGRSFGVSDMTVRKYIDLLESTFMIRTLQPWYINIGKRMIKRPKIYLRDSGIFHSLMSFKSMDEILTHPKLGSSWEGFALECVCNSIGKRSLELFFWRTHNGSEIDLLWQDGGKTWGVEFKYADAPKISKSMRLSIEDLNLEHLWIVYPGHDQYSLSEDITVLPLYMIQKDWDYTNV